MRKDGESSQSAWPKSLQPRLANPGRSHLRPIAGHGGETGRRPPRLRSPADVASQGLPPCDFLSFVHALSPQLEARPQAVDGELKVAPMISAANSFIDPRSQTADEIVRICRALEVQPAPFEINTRPLNHPLLETSFSRISQAGPESGHRRNVVTTPSAGGSPASRRSCRSNHGPPFFGAAHDGSGNDGENANTTGWVWNLRSKGNQVSHHRLP